MTLAEVDLFHHDAFLYCSDEELGAGLEPYVREGLAAGDAVVAVLPERNTALLRQRLGDAAADVRFVGAEDWYRRPSTTIASYDRVLDELDGQRARVIGEVQFGKDPGRWAEWTRYEASLNEVFQSRNAHVVCPYDARALPLPVVEDACRTHPAIWTGQARQPSSSYTDPRSLASELAPPIPAPATSPDLDLWVEGVPLEARQAFTRAACAARIDPEEAAGLALAVNEILTNALLHGGGRARMRIWPRPPAGLVCAVTDGGSGIADPLIGFAPPNLTATGGRGMWLARQLFDRVELEYAPDGFTVWLATNPD